MRIKQNFMEFQADFTPFFKKGWVVSDQIDANHDKSITHFFVELFSLSNHS